MTSPAPVRLPPTVWILAAISLAVALGFGIVAPVLPTFARSFGVGNFASAAIISVFAAMRLVFSPVIGRLDDRFGPRLVLTAGLVIVGVSSALAGLAGTYIQLLALRGIGGIGSAMFSVAGMSLLLGAVPAQQRGRASALYQGGFLVGAIAGPGLGGLVSAISLRAPFFFYAGTLAVAAAVGLALKAGRRPRPKRPGQLAEPPRRPLHQILADRDYQAALVTNFCNGWNSHGVRSAMVPLLVATMYADPTQAARWTGIAMAVAAGVQALTVWPAGSLTDRLGRKRPIIFGTLACAVATSLIPLTSSIVPLTIVLAGYALGSATLGSAPAAVVGDVAGPRGDRAVALFSMSADLGAIIGPLAAGVLADHVGFVSAFAVGAVFWLVAAVMAGRMRGRRRGMGNDLTDTR